METVIGVLLIVMGIFLIISVLMQSSKDHRLSGSIAGGAETFFGKQKGKTLDALFNKLTTVVTIIFVVLVLVLYVMQPSSSEILAQMNQNPTEQTGGETGDNTDVTGENTDNQGENADANDENADANADNGTEADANTDANADEANADAADTGTEADSAADAE